MSPQTCRWRRRKQQFRSVIVKYLAFRVPTSISRKLGAAAAVLLLLAGCAVNPVTGDRQFVLVSEDQEIAMGLQGAESVAQSIGLVDDPALQEYVSNLGMRIAQESERPSLPWSFQVIDDPTPNAFAFPGGPIFVTRGLLSLMRNEAELVSVLGHEVGHVTARHSVAMITRAQVAQIGLGVGMILSPTIAQLGEALAGGLSLLFLSYGRDAERQADDLGFRYALDQGYDVREMPNVFASLQHAGELAGHSPLPQWLASHPHPEERIQRIERQLTRLERPLDDARVGTDDFMARINGMIFGANPRNGFFEEGRFLHPDLEFQVTFPGGWRTQNLPQAVMAGSPEEDAVMQLTLVQAAPREAANQFFGQEPITAGRVGSQTINGLPAVVGNFQAQTQQGQVAGVAAFIQHGGRTYQLVGFTPADRYGRHDPTFRATIGSFAPLTDPAALGRQPDRLEIVRTDAPMTLAQFNERHPSAIGIDQLALINQLAGAEATIPAGTPVKRVVRPQ
jgi:predicted Zn-dependent protease